ncbi:MAG: YjbQ family protein [Candidatus Altiarchaeales archaeon]|nr:YjbQ family protein [Candidatus Altiarchaeales archaeon]MBD3416264.1 YjbQ family protein [Candidatus Altiarchaeales archaeon]
MEFQAKTGSKEGLVDITSEVQEMVSKSGVKDGLCVIYCPHTTAAVTVNEGADPDVQADMIKSLGDIVKDVGFEHSEGNSPAHVKSSLLGCSSTVLVAGGMLKLGAWQRIFLCEFDGPRKRKVWVSVVGQM